MKKLKKSNRGLTFALDEKGLIGSKYRYIVDIRSSKVIIVPDENGPMTVSRKRSGKTYKPLYDIRSKEVKNLVSKSDYLEVEVLEDKIIVHTYQKEKFRLIRNNIVSIEDILGKRTGEIILPKAVGEYEQLNIFDYLGSSYNTEDIPVSEVKTVYDVVSLFSGAGLLDYSFKDPRFRILYGIDFDEDACMTYRENIGNHIVCKDIRDINEAEVPKSDIVIGSPNCQGFSNANRSNIDTKVALEKRLLIEDYIRIVKANHPKVFSLENVPQFYTKDNGIFFDTLINGLSEYDISYATIEDYKVGGYTSRKRAVVIGSRIGHIDIPTKTIHSLKTVREALSKVDASWYNFNDITVSRKETQEILSYVPEGGNWKDVPEWVHKFHPSTHSDRYTRLDPDAIAPTIVNWRKIIMAPPNGNRILSVAEAVALMGFDKSFKVLGRTLNSRQQQIGNAVPKAIGDLIKTTVLKKLDELEIKNLKVLA